MSMTDPVADMLTRLRNANALMRGTVRVPSTAIKISVAEVLKREGFIKDFRIEEKPLQNELVVELKYGPEGEKVIRSIERASKPGCRVYRGFDDLPNVLNGLGIAIVSTNQGLFSDRECRARKVGGEIICIVY